MELVQLDLLPTDAAVEVEVELELELELEEEAQTQQAQHRPNAHTAQGLVLWMDHPTMCIAI